MLYFFRPEADPCSPLSGHMDIDELSPPQSISRYYISSDLWLEQLGGAVKVFGRAEHECSQATMEEFRGEARVHLRGKVRFGNGFRIYQLLYPWRTKVLEIPKEVPGLTPYPGKLPEYFYRRKIGLFGGPGSGKTCIARALSNKLSIEMGISADCPYEYASTFISRYGPPQLEDQIWILLHQWEREEDISQTKQIMISDCPHPLVFVYLKSLARAEGRGTDKSLPWAYRMALRGLEAFDTRVFLPFREERCTRDGIRIHNPLQAKKITAQIMNFLDDTGVSYIHYRDDLDELVQKTLLLNG